MSQPEYPVTAVVVRVERLFPPWVGATISNNIIYVRRDVTLSVHLLAHELCHLHQRQRLGWRFLFVYLWQWANVGFRYYWIPLEVAARAAESDPYYLGWAREVLREGTQ